MPSSSDKEKENLINFVYELAGREVNLVEEDFGSGFYRLHLNEAEKRQARHDIRYVEDALVELLRNSRDSNATHIAVALHLRNGRYRDLTVIDNGQGIPAKYHEIIFEPRVTSRLLNFIEDDYGVHGRGMALYAVKERSLTAKVFFSKPDAGTSVGAVFDIKTLPEKKNQAERPRVIRDKDGFIVKGVKNLSYVLTEFSLKNPDIELFAGSPSEILALILKSPGYSMLRKAVFGEYLENPSAEKLLFLSECIGLKISLRNTYRVMAGEISPPTVVRNSWISRTNYHLTKNAAIRFNYSDWKKIKECLEGNLKPFIDTYGLKISEIKQTRKKNEIKITISIEENEEI